MHHEGNFITPQIWQYTCSSVPSPTQILLRTAKSPPERTGPKNQRVMKKDLHPKSYRLVVFKDMSNNYTFLSRSTAASKETIKWDDGKEYPLVKLEISNTSHPFFTGKNMLVDTAGRIDKFKKKYAKKGE
jgi:large subunit ribosomal protein L31